MSNIFITGATGFLGSKLVDEILSSTDSTVHALVRGRNTMEAEKRLLNILNSITDTNGSKAFKRDRLKIYAGDITKENLGLDENMVNHLIESIDIIYHSAATTDLTMPLEEASLINTNGTENVLKFALSGRKQGRLKKLNHVSTCYIAGTAGKKKSTFNEDDLNVGQKFYNTYEKSKFEAEVKINEYRGKGLDIDIFRPSIILGNHKDGKTINFKMFYQPLHFFSLELFDRIPAAKDSMANLINVDIAAKAIFLITNLSNRKNMTYHITSPKAPPFDYVLDIASDYFGFKKPDFIPPKDFDIHREYSPTRRMMIEPYLPYFDYFTEFDMQNTLSQLKQEKFAFPEFDESNFTRLFEYCDKVGFIKRKTKNVTVG